SPSASTSESHGGGRGHVKDQELLGAPLQTARELDCFSAHIHLREPDKSDDKAEWSKGARKRRPVQWGSTTLKQSVGQKGGGLEEHHSAVEAIYQLRRKGCRCKVTDSRTMGLAAP
ncbi:hypothetical protein BHM03_00043300, partial [Ensete ventricosum]